MPVPNIYPISLGAMLAEALVMKHARTEFDEATRWHTARAEYDFSADVQENGDVKLWVGYNDFNGFCHSGGGLFSKIIRPFSVKEMAELKEMRMTAIAEAEYFARKKREEDEEIHKIKAELFGLLETDSDDDGQPSG